MQIEVTDRLLMWGRRSLCRMAGVIAIACVTALSATAAHADESALEFDGTQWVDGTNSDLPQGNAARTMEAWINPSVTHNGTIFNYGTFAANKRAGILYISGKLYFVGEFNDVIGTTVLPVDEWTHVAVSYDGTNMTLYVNGVADVSTSRFSTGPLNTTGYDWRIGNGVDINYLRESFQGTIDEVRVWDYARTQTQINVAKDFGMTGNEPGLVAYYKLDDGTGSTTTEDSSPSMSDGVLDGTETLPDWVDGHEQIDPNGGFGPYNRPVFLVLSLVEDFEIPDLDDCDEGENGSQTYFINIGDFIAGQEIPDTRFEILEILADIELPYPLVFEDLNGYQFTIIGSFNTFSASSIHLVSPSEEPIPTEVQEAFFLASPFLDMIPEFPAPTTVEVAQFVFDTAVAFGIVVELQDIMDHVFITGGDLVCTDCQAEGEMFGHGDPDTPLFGYSFEIDEDDGTVAVTLRLKVELDLKPGDDKNIVNHKSKGKVWCAILTTDGFDAVDEVVVDSVLLGGAEPLQSKEEDVDGDGRDDLVLKFDRQDIGLDENTETVTLTGDRYDGGFIEGDDAVITVPSDNGKKNKKK